MTKDTGGEGRQGREARARPPGLLAGRAQGAAATAVRLWGLAFACLIPMLIVSVLALWIGRQHTPRPFRPFEAALLLVDWSIWAGLAPLVVALVWWIPLTSGRWVRGLSAHLVIGALVALGEMALFIASAKAIGGYRGATFAQAYWSMLTLWYPYALLVYWVIAIAAQAVLTSRRARDRALESARLREQLTQAQLDALRMQLHPHFLCNTLNTVAVFLRDGLVDQAGRIVTGLGELLHTALDRMDADEVTLRDELEFVGRYLEIERVRFSDRLDVAVRADRAALDGLVPRMILQPVVENAIRHGISKDPAAGLIRIEARRAGGGLALTVTDDGPGPGGVGSGTEGHGVGLHNTRMRLAFLYGDAAGLTLRARPGGGTRVEISIPFHTRPTADGRPAAVPA